MALAFEYDHIEVLKIKKSKYKIVKRYVKGFAEISEDHESFVQQRKFQN